MVSNQTGPLLYLVSHRELSSVPLLFSLHINDITADIESKCLNHMDVLA